MITMLFISDDNRVADLVARFQPHLRARMRLALDFDQGLKEVFDHRPSAVFIQADISGISGETVARHIKTLLRTEAPRVVLIHSSPLSVRGTNKWFDDSVDFSLPHSELVQQFRSRLMEIAPDHWIENWDEQSRSMEGVAGASADFGDVSMPVTPHPGEFEFFDWEAPGNGLAPAADVFPLQAAPNVTDAQGSAPLTAVPPVLPGREGDFRCSGMLAPEPEFPDVKSPVEEVSFAPESSFLKEVLSPAGTPLPIPPLREAESMPAPSPRPLPRQTEAAPGEQSTASRFDFSAEIPVANRAGRVNIPSSRRECARGKGTRLVPWAAAIVVLLIGVAVLGVVLFAGKGSREQAPAGPAAQVETPVRSLTAPPSAANAAPAGGLPSFIPGSGKDEGYGKDHPGWERYRNDGIEYRLFREQGRLKAVQVIALRGKTIPDALLVAIVKELTGSEDLTVSSLAKKGGYRRESGRVIGKGEVVIYRKGGGIRGVVVTLG